MTAMSDIRKIFYWQSDNLLNWSKISEFGPLGAVSGVWECPDLFKLKIVNEDNVYKWVQIVSIKSRSSTRWFSISIFYWGL